MGFFKSNHISRFHLMSCRPFVCVSVWFYLLLVEAIITILHLFFIILSKKKSIKCAMTDSKEKAWPNQYFLGCKNPTPRPSRAPRTTFFWCETTRTKKRLTELWYSLPTGPRKIHQKRKGFCLKINITLKTYMRIYICIHIHI